LSEGQSLAELQPQTLPERQIGPALFPLQSELLQHPDVGIHPPLQDLKLLLQLHEHAFPLQPAVAFPGAGQPSKPFCWQVLMQAK
jgi:hypothetical protein